MQILINKKDTGHRKKVVQTGRCVDDLQEPGRDFTEKDVAAESF